MQSEEKQTNLTGFRTNYHNHRGAKGNGGRVVDFQFVQLFSHCEYGNDDFQALSLSDQKPDVF